MEIKELRAEFILGAANSTQFPKINMPEAAFAGRSNVGKSSLINSLVLNKNLAKTSSTPGKTQQINFFNIESKWILADLPGFGYAAASKEDRKKWSELNYNYLESRENLKLVCSLIDSRHDPMDSDIALIERLENLGRDYLLILTKCDKISKKAVIDRKQQIEHLVSQCSHCREVLPYSSQTSMGRFELIAILNKTLKI